VAEEGAPRHGHLGLAELVRLAQELQHVRAAAPGQHQRRAVEAQVQPERVPVQGDGLASTDPPGARASGPRRGSQGLHTGGASREACGGATGSVAEAATRSRGGGRRRSARVQCGRGLTA
jgi:hypothetical protein